MWCRLKLRFVTLLRPGLGANDWGWMSRSRVKRGCSVRPSPVSRLGFVSGGIPPSQPAAGTGDFDHFGVR